MNKSLLVVTSRFAAAALLALAGCGGGADTKTGSGGTGDTPPPAEPTVASGALTGLGPLGLAGASFDDATTQVLLNINAGVSANQLRLGMTANTNGTASSATASGRAFGAVVQSLVLGPATSVDAPANRLTVLSIAVRVDQNTLLAGLNSLAELRVGDVVEVFGLALPTGQGILATRLIVQRPASSANVEVLGVISQVGATSLVLQGIPVNLANTRIGASGATGVVFSPSPGPAALTTGVLARVIGVYDSATGGLNATTIATSLAPARVEGELVFIEGFVREPLGSAVAATRFSLPDLDIEIGSVPAVAGSIVSGTRVRVRGKMQMGVLKAEAIDIIAPSARTEFVVAGEVAAFTSAALFEVRGELIDATLATFSGGTIGNLATGKRVRVKGFAGPGRLVASEVLFVN